MTKVRPCIDLHNGICKQIVGSTFKSSSEAGGGSGGGGGGNEESSSATTSSASVNFSSDRPPSHFTELYRRDALEGGHVIMLGQNDANRQAARDALKAWPQGLQVGGGVTGDNAREWLEAGASHVIVTSYVFSQGRIDWDRLEKLVELIGKDQLVLDLSCRRKKKEKDGEGGGGDDDGNSDDDQYYVVTNQWQTFTETPVTPETLAKLAQYCSEFLVHAVDCEGKQSGIQGDLVEFLGHHSPLPVTYAGGVRSLEDLDLVEKLGQGKVDVTVGSALDIFGGSLPYEDVVEWHRRRNK